MNEINPQQILNQIRELSSELHGIVPGVSETHEPSQFGDLLKTAITEVNETQQAAGELKRSFAAEESGTDLTEVMIASQKADLSFRAMTEVRNKLVTAYQDIMNMPV